MWPPLTAESSHHDCAAVRRCCLPLSGRLVLVGGQRARGQCQRGPLAARTAALQAALHGPSLLSTQPTHSRRQPLTRSRGAFVHIQVTAPRLVARHCCAVGVRGSTSDVCIPTSLDIEHTVSRDRGCHTVSLSGCRGQPLLHRCVHLVRCNALPVQATHCARQRVLYNVSAV